MYGGLSSNAADKECRLDLSDRDDSLPYAAEGNQDNIPGKADRSMDV